MYERCLHIVYSSNRSFFEDLLDQDKIVSIQVRSLQTLALETLKVAKNMSAPVVSEMFEKRSNVYDLRNLPEFVLSKVHSVFHDIESI